MRIAKLSLILFFLISFASLGSGVIDNIRIKLFIKSAEKLNSEENLVKSIATINSLTLEITFENDSIITIPNKLATFKTLDWVTQFNFSNQDTIELFSIGNNLNIDSPFDPESSALLSREILINLPYSGTLNWISEGRHGVLSNIQQENFDVQKGDNSFYIHGLYSDGSTSVTINYLNNQGKLRYSKVLEVESGLSQTGTDLLEVNFETVYTDNSQTQKLFLTQHRNGSGIFMIDQYGDMRWYLDVANKTGIYGLQQNKIGNILWAQNQTLYETSLSGEYLNISEIPAEYGSIHHDLVQIRDEQFLLTVNHNKLNSIEDMVILYDRTENSVIKEWDLNESIPKSNFFMETRIVNEAEDWFHNNSIEFIDKENSLILSGQRYGVVKLTWDNELVWILSDPIRFQSSDLEYQQKVLSNIDQRVITWGQHDIKFDKKTNSFFLFDNGLGRDYASYDRFSQVVHFSVNEEDLSYDIIKFYGNNYPEYYSPIISGFDIATDGSVLALFGSIAYDLPYESNIWPDMDKIWKNPAPEYGAVIVEFNKLGDVTLEIKVSLGKEIIENDRGLYTIRNSQLTGFF